MQYSPTSAALGALASVVLLGTSGQAVVILPHGTPITHGIRPTPPASPFTGSTVDLPIPTGLINIKPVQPRAVVPALGGPGIKVTVQDGRTVNVLAGSKVIGGLNGGFYTVDGGSEKHAIKAGEQQMAIADKDEPAAGGPGIKVTVQNGNTVNVLAGSKIIGGPNGGFYTVNGGSRHAIKAGEQQIAIADN